MALPDFDRPPVVEVAVGVEFVPIPGLGLARMVELHETWKAAYPKLQEQSALPSIPQPGTVLAGIGLTIGQGREPLRLWMLSEDEHTLVQVQHDRLILNWRRLDEQAEYPRYRVLRLEFLERWRQFVLAIRELGAVRPLIADVTFVNSIESPAGRGDLARILTTAASPTGLPGALFATHTQHVIDVGASLGRPAHLVAAAGPDAARAEAVSLQIITRIALGGEASSEEEMMKFLDHAHDIGVRGFTSLTTAPMHQAWGRTT